MPPASPAQQQAIQAVLDGLGERSSRTRTTAEARASAERVRRMLGGRQFSDSTDLIREHRDP
jgi:hypothetical protein